ncbi:MAG: glycosyltransferase family 2 protein [Gammaproteobacteria bacterium]|nr:glycosyltransferase family 2 protein [Gammaproteobacteria bacterium]
MTGLSVVIPVFRGAETIGPLARELARLDIDGGLELVLVNDGSPDDSSAVIRALVDELPVPVIAIDLARNFGEHNAVMAGYAAARGSYVINIDDDFQNPPSEVRKLYDYARAHPELDVVYTRYAWKQHPMYRNLGSRFTNWVAGLLLDKPKGLYLSSFRCINAFLRERVNGYAGPYPYIDGLILQTTQRIGTIEVLHNERTQGSSGYTFRKLARLWIAMFVNFSVMPLRASSLLGFGISLLGMLVAVAAVVERFLGNTPQGWTSLMAAILVFSGVQLLMLGLVGEYLGRLYLTTTGRPQYVVRDVHRRGDDLAG